ACILQRQIQKPSIRAARDAANSQVRPSARRFVRDRSDIVQFAGGHIPAKTRQPARCCSCPVELRLILRESQSVAALVTLQVPFLVNELLNDAQLAIRIDSKDADCIVASKTPA